MIFFKPNATVVPTHDSHCRKPDQSLILVGPENYGTMVSGPVQDCQHFPHKLRANAGQKLFAELGVANTNGNGTIYFNLLPPGSSDDTACDEGIHHPRVPDGQ